MEQYVIDAYDDKGLSVLKQSLQNDANRAEMTKVASRVSLMTPVEVKSLRDEQFALKVMTKQGSVYRKFPLNSPEQVWLSSHYFTKTAGCMPKMAQAVAACSIHHSARVFNVPVDEMFSKIASMYNFGTNLWVEGVDFPVKTAGLHEDEDVDEMFRKTDSRYWGLSEGDNKKYWLGSQDHVKVASAYLDKHARSFTPRQRHEFANRVAARAWENGQSDVLNSGGVCKFAGVGFGKRFEPELERRIDLVSRKGYDPKHYGDLYKKASALGPARTASIMGVLDNAYGIEKYYDESLDDNYTSTYGGYQTKKAEASLEIGDENVTVSQLRTIPEQVFKKSFGLSAWNEFKRDPISITASMPRTEQELIANMIP